MTPSNVCAQCMGVRGQPASCHHPDEGAAVVAATGGCTVVTATLLSLDEDELVLRLVSTVGTMMTIRTITMTSVTIPIIQIFFYKMEKEQRYTVMQDTSLDKGWVCLQLKRIEKALWRNKN